VPDVHDGTARGAVRVRTILARPDQQPGDVLDGALRGRQTDALRPGRRDVMQALEGQREV
jgi:hypothetical protein